jgi:metal-sulfur cluster biosynthetic enzyme
MAVSRRAVADALKQVIDPEVGLNIVDLGLVYHLHIEDGDTVYLDLTMTTPACPMSSYIKQEAVSALKTVPGLRRAQIDLVWEPAWSPRMINPDVRERHFGPMPR